MKQILKQKSLRNKRIVITRRREQSAELKTLLEENGAEVVELPLIEIFEYHDEATLNDVFSELGSYTWIVFTSTNGIHYFFKAFFQKFRDIRCVGGAKFACVGKSTASEIERYHLEVDCMPEIATSDALADALINSETLDNEKILVITGNLNRAHLVEKLERNGRAIVDTLQVYKNEKTDLNKNEAAESFRKKGAHAIVFISSSAVQSFRDQVEHLQINPLGQHPIACSIGPSTSATMRELGIKVDTEAKESSLQGIIDALIDAIGD